MPFSKHSFQFSDKSCAPPVLPRFDLQYFPEKMLTKSLAIFLGWNRMQVTCSIASIECLMSRSWSEALIYEVYKLVEVVRLVQSLTEMRRLGDRVRHNNLTIFVFGPSE